MVGLYLTLLLLTSLPSVQRWAGGVASRGLSAELGTSVTIGNLRLGLFNRVVADDIVLLDQRGDTLLRATRLGAKVRLKPLFSGKIRLASAQLFGFEINLKKRTEDEPYNVQFVIDKLSNPDKDEPSKLDLAINSVIVRRGVIRHELEYKPRRSGFDAAHVELKDFSLKASVKGVTDKEVNVVVGNLGFSETISGLRVEDMRCAAMATDQSLCIQDFYLELPNSWIGMEELRVKGEKRESEKLNIKELSFSIDGAVTPSDFEVFVPALSSLDEQLRLQTSGSFDGKKITIPSFVLSGDGVNARFSTEINADLSDLKKLSGQLRLHNLDVNAAKMAVAVPHLQDLPINIQALGSCHADGVFQLSMDSVVTDGAIDCSVSTGLGDIGMKGSLVGADQFELTLRAEKLAPSVLFAGDKAPWFVPDKITVDTHLSGSQHEKTIEGTMDLSDIQMLRRHWQQLHIEGKSHTRTAQLKMSMSEPDYRFALVADLNNKQDFMADTDLLNHLSGEIELNDVGIHDPDFSLDMQHALLSLDNSQPKRRLSLRSDYVDADTEGEYDVRSLPASAQLLAHRIWPSLIARPMARPHIEKNEIRFDIMLRNPDPLLRLTKLDLSIPERGEMNGILSVPEGHAELTATLPHLIYGNEDLHDISFTLSSYRDSLYTDLKLQRAIKSGLANLILAAEGGHDRLLSELVWDVPSTPVVRGRVTTDTHFSLDAAKKLAADIKVLPTGISIGDTLWHVREASLALSNNVLTVNNLQVENDHSFLRIGGRASKNLSDHLWVELQDMSLGYILSFIKIGGVDLDATVSGTVLAHHLFAQPMIEANVLARDFSVNNCVVGDTRAHGGWERNEPNTIDITADIIDPATSRRSHATCIIHPGHKPNSGIDLRVNANHLSAAFVGRYTDSFMRDFSASATGDVRLYGPFSALDLDGDARLDTAAFTIPSLGVRYHAQGGTIQLRPGSCKLQNLVAHDRAHTKGSDSHTATINGSMTYEHFKNIAYDISFNATDMLCYDFRDFDDMPFYATVFATGTAHLAGNTSQLAIDLHGQPTAGTTLTYNASSPETTTNSQFITFTSPEQSQSSSHNSGAQGASLPNSSGIDMRINFDLDVRPEATMRLLMDQRTSDYITLNGHGKMTATYHNRGAFQLYGVYHVERGTYRLTMQDILRKDFQFQPGGTLTFGGQPLKAALDLQAVYTVPSVSLNDLAAGSNISNSNVRVNCLMNIGGLAEQPQVTFDFDIPNVNEDEKQMVRSLINTEEERNLQVIYLLGIGRFYTYDYAADQSQTGTAMNSLLSSTLSGQLNAILSNAMGNTSWNFGTNLSTGQEGWNAVDVEGMLSGRMLNNRLLFNGTFGYRDRPMTASNNNFVGDFDLQYLLNSSGNIRLKAYSETNDRYFTKSALTTQGVGILLRKDFNTLRDLLRKK